MKKLIIFLSLLAMLAVCCNARDVNDSFSSSYNTCLEDATSTKDSVDCINKEIAQQNERLEKSLNELYAKLSKQRKQELKYIQQQWQQYIKANCGFYISPKGGSVATLLSGQCHLDAIAMRADELQELIKFNN